MHLQNQIYPSDDKVYFIMKQLKQIQCSNVYNKNGDNIDEEKTIFTGSVFDLLEARCRKAAFDNP